MRLSRVGTEDGVLGGLHNGREERPHGLGLPAGGDVPEDEDDAHEPTLGVMNRGATVVDGAFSAVSR